MSLLKDIWNAVSGIGKGMQKTYDEQFDPVFTEMYPFVQPKLPPVSVQSLALIQNEDGSDRCVSCLACEKVCPSQVITIERKKNPAGKGFVLERFDIDLVNCMYCAACVESCPASAIVTIQDFELSTFNLQSLKADKDFLDQQGLRADQWYSPKIGVEYREGTSENNPHGKIVKAPLEEQPGGLALLEKQKESAAVAAPAPAAAPAAKPAAAPAPTVSSAPAAATVPAVPAEDKPKSPKIKRWNPGGAATSSEAAPAAEVAPAAAAPAAEAPAAAPQGIVSSAPATGEAPRSSKIKRWNPGGAPAPAAEAPSPAPEPVKAEAAPVVETPTPAEPVQAETVTAPVVSSEPVKADVAPAPAPPVVEPVMAPVAEPAVSSEPEPIKAEAAPVAEPVLAPVVAEPEPVKAEAPAAPAPSSAGVSNRDDLEVIEGIGPKRAEVLYAAGITTFKALASSTQATLEKIMSDAGLSLEPGIATWATQAEFLVKGDQAGFKAYTDSLVGGKVKKNPKVKRWEPKS